MKFILCTAMILISLLLLISGCTGNTPTATPQVEGLSPALRTITGPTYVCSATTQLTLQALVDDISITGEPGQWQLYSADDGTIIHNGIWDLTNTEVIITPPDEQPLPAGDYEVRFVRQGQGLGSHLFTVSSIEPGITNLSISAIPQHIPLTELTEGTQHFYINFAWVGGCVGSSYRLEVYLDDTMVCQHTGVLNEDGGSASQPCYLEDGTRFEPGVYTAVFTLMDNAEQSLAFNVKTPEPLPTPLPTSTPQPIECGPAFSAAGITPENEIYRPLDIFDWYTQAVYVGTRCRNLTPQTDWRSIWYRNGEMVRSITHTWEDGDTGIIWDTFTGVPLDPFVHPGTYSTTLEIGTTAPITIEFRVLAYIPSDGGETTNE